MDSIYGNSISPEQELVLSLIRVDWSQNEQIQSLLAGKLDWSAITGFTTRNGLLPLVYSRLKTFEELHVPAEDLERIKTLFLTNAQRNLRLTRLLARISDMLSQEHIQHIPIKGPALAIQLYGDLSLRQFTDLDILIHEQDFSNCIEILSDAGFETGLPVNEIEESWLLRGIQIFSFPFRVIISRSTGRLPRGASIIH